jgi:hypothetical protein
MPSATRTPVAGMVLAIWHFAAIAVRLLAQTPPAQQPQTPPGMRETGSRWQQSTGDAISDPLKGAHLELYPFVWTTWKEWRRRYPITVVLKPLPGYDDRMPNFSKRINAVTRSDAGAAPPGEFGHDHRLHPKQVMAFWFAWSEFHPQTNVHGSRSAPRRV